MFRNVIFLSILICIGVGFFLFNSTTIAPSNDLFERNEESARKHEWNEERLRDPLTGKIPEGIRYKELAFYKSLSMRHQKRGAEWRLRGPYNVGGRTRGMAIDCKNENHMIAGSVSGGIWSTQNGGASWTKVSQPNDHPGIVSICQDTRPGYENIWYALSGEIYGTSASGARAFYLGDGAFRSTDNGLTWTSLGSTAGGVPTSFTQNFQGGWRIVCNPTDGSVLMACYGSIFRSIDTGNSWQVVLGSGNASYFSDVVVSKNGVVYASLSSDGVRGGFYRSADGITFTDITPSYLYNHNRTVVEVDPNNDNIAYFLSEVECDTCGGAETSNYEGDKEYVSLQKYSYLSGTGTPSSGGGQWFNLSNNLPLDGIEQFDKFNCQGGYDLCIRVQPGNSNNIIIGGTNLYVNTNGFATKENTKQIGGYGIATTLPFFQIYPNHHPDQHDVFFSPSNNRVLYSISDGGVKKSYDFLAQKVEWQDLSLGYITSQCYTVNIDEENAGDKRMMVGLQDNGNFVSYSDNPQQKWVMPVNGDGAYGYISPNHNFIVTSIQLGRIAKIFLDERGNLVRRRRIDPAGKTQADYSFIHPFAVDPNNEDIMYLPIGKKLYRLDNLKSIEINNDYSQLSDTWIELPDSITTANYVSGTTVTPAEISCISISKAPANIVYIGTNNREIWRIDQANTNQPIWTKTSLTRLPNGGYVNDIAIDPDDANKVLVAYSNYNVTSLFYTEDGGQVWKLAGGNLEGINNSSGSNPSTRSLAILKRPNGQKTYFVGTSVGLFSTDSLKANIAGNMNITEWVQESPNLIGANVIEDIKVRQSDGLVVAATHGNGVFENYYNSLSNPPVGNVRLLSNLTYPIPTSNMLQYSFAIGIEAEINASIYNTVGQRMYSKNLGLHTDGMFTYSLSIGHLPNGIYFLTIRDVKSKENYTQKLIVQH